MGRFNESRQAVAMRRAAEPDSPLGAHGVCLHRLLLLPQPGPRQELPEQGTRPRQRPAPDTPPRRPMAHPGPVREAGGARPARTIPVPDTNDDVWIPETARQGWLIITRDRHIQDHRAEIEAVRSSGARKRLDRPDLRGSGRPASSPILTPTTTCGSRKPPAGDPHVVVG